MNRELSRRRLLASSGLLASGAAAAAVAGSSRGRAEPSQESSDQWSETYGDDPVTTAAAVAERDGEYAAVGSTGDGESGTGWLFGVDGSSGAGTWSTTVSNDGLDALPVLQAIAPADDGGYVLVGVPQTTGPTSVVKTSETGDVEWWETFAAEASGDAEASLFGQALAATDAGYVVGGFRVEGQDFTAVTLTVDGDGNELGRTRYFEDDVSTVLGLAPLDEGFVAAGERQPAGDGGSTLRGNLFRVGADRSVQWQSDFVGEIDGQAQVGQFRDVVALDDGYLAAGNVITSNQASKGWVVSTDDSGSGREVRTVDPQAVTTVTSATAVDGGAVVAGQVRERVDSDTRAAWIAGFDAATATRWQETRTQSDVNVYQDVTAASDGGVVAAGSAQRNSQDADVLARAWLTKFGDASVPTPDGTPTDDGDDPTPSPTRTATPTPVEGGTPTPTADATPTPSPTARSEPTATTEPAGTTDDGGPVTPDPDETTTSDGGPGFGVGSALAAIGAGTALRRLGYLGGDDE